jgi:hypothetical protein
MSGNALLERAYPDPDCGCPVEEWVLNGVSLQIHFEDDGVMEVFADTGDWDANVPLKATTMEAAREEAFAWVRALPTEDELVAARRALSPEPLEEGSSSVAGVQAGPIGPTEGPGSTGLADVNLRNAASVCNFMAAIKMAHAGPRADLSVLRQEAERADRLHDNASKVAPSGFGGGIAAEASDASDAIRSAIVEIERYRALSDEPISSGSQHLGSAEGGAGKLPPDEPLNPPPESSAGQPSEGGEQ